MLFSSIKEINECQTFTIEENFEKNLKKFTSFEEQKSTSYIQGNVWWCPLLTHSNTFSKTKERLSFFTYVIRMFEFTCFRSSHEKLFYEKYAQIQEPLFFKFSAVLNKLTPNF